MAGAGRNVAADRGRRAAGGAAGRPNNRVSQWRYSQPALSRESPTRRAHRSLAYLAGLATVVGAATVGPGVARGGQSQDAPGRSTLAIPGAALGPVQRVPLQLSGNGAGAAASASASPTGAAVLEHRDLLLHGLPVRGAFARDRVAPDGTRTSLVQRMPAAAPQRIPSQARIDAARAETIAMAHVARRRTAHRAATAIAGTAASRSGAATGGAPTGSRMVYLMVLGEPLLAWEVDLPLTTDPEPSRPRVWVSAATGRVLDELERVQSSRSRVFPTNPAATPEPIEVELPVDADGPGVPLDAGHLVALGCTDEVPEDPEDIAPWHDEGDCYPVAGVLSDDNGDFFVPLPDIVKPRDNIEGHDGYAQVSMLYHAQVFLDAIEQRGIESFRCERATLLANFRELEPSGSLIFTAVNNAFWTGDCEEDEGPSMIFGQGSEVDFGFDGDVVYHEMGHGLVSHLTAMGLSRRRLRPDASVVDAGAANEAIADYLSVMITEDPQLAEYVGRFWSANASPYIRTAENTKVCPDTTIGQVHNDGEPLMAALWSTRKRTGAGLDLVVLETLTRLPPDATLEEIAATLREVTAEHIESGQLDADVAEHLSRALSSRGLDDCPRVMVDPKRVDAGVTMHLRRVTDAATPFYPGPMQLRWTVPEGVDRATVSFRLVAKSSSDPVRARVLVKREDAAIGFEYSLVAVDEPPPPLPEGEEPTEEELDAVREVILVTGDWDEEIEPSVAADNDYVATVTGLSPGEVIHLALVNVSPTEAVASSVRVRTEPRPDGEADEDEAGTGGEAAMGVDVVESGAEAAGGCTCRADADGARWSWLALGLVPLGWRRRRRRPMGSGPRGRRA